MAIPSRIRSIEGSEATVDCFGVSRVVSLLLLDEPAAVGDYVIIQAGQFAMEKVPEDEALAALDYLAAVVDSRP